MSDGTTFIIAFITITAFWFGTQALERYEKHIERLANCEAAP